MQGLLSGLTGPTANIDVAFTDVASRLYKQLDNHQRLYIFSTGEDVCGEMKITVMGGKRIDHVGIRVELRGVVEVTSDKSVTEVCCVAKDLSGPGQLSGLQALKWSFPKAVLPAESYTGINARIRYFVRAVILRQGYATASISKELEFAVHNPSPPKAVADVPSDTSVKLEVGIEDCLHIEFQYDSTVAGLGDVVTGHVDFLLVRIRIKHAELALIRREAVGTPGTPHAVNDSETVSRFEIMDGAPVKGERIPLRMFLGGLDVGPTLTGVGGVLTVKYFLNLVLVDEEDRRYFKQHELTLERRV